MKLLIVFLLFCILVQMDSISTIFNQKFIKKGVSSILISAQLLSVSPAFAASKLPELGSRYYCFKINFFRFCLSPVKVSCFRAPSFVLPSNRDKPISLEDLKGKWTVLYFYPVRSTP